MDSTAETFGIKTLSVNFHSLKPIIWNFVVADLNQAILGADFLKFNDLMPEDFIQLTLYCG